MALLRFAVILTSVTLLASTHANAQTSCQPTITQPCAQQPRPEADQTKPTGADKTKSAKGAKVDGPRLTPDSGFGVDSHGGLGSQRQIRAGIGVPF
jgi:hypothetical protein